MADMELRWQIDLGATPRWQIQGGGHRVTDLVEEHKKRVSVYCVRGWFAFD